MRGKNVAKLTWSKVLSSDFVCVYVCMCVCVCAFILLQPRLREDVTQDEKCFSFSYLRATLYFDFDCHWLVTWRDETGKRWDFLLVSSILHQTQMAKTQHDACCCCIWLLALFFPLLHEIQRRGEKKKRETAITTKKQSDHQQVLSPLFFKW